MRRHREREWGCHNLELTVSRLSQTEAFARFARHILDDLPRFRESYNAASGHTARSTASQHEPPGHRNWPKARRRSGCGPPPAGASGRHAASDVRQLRPRALTLTLFARVCLGDFFIHGIGGGKYDEVTDAIIRDYFGIEPPAYQVLSATLHLPLPAFPATGDDVKRAERRVRDLHWNPQMFVVPGTTARVARTPRRARGKRAAVPRTRGTQGVVPGVAAGEGTIAADCGGLRTQCGSGA